MGKAASQGMQPIPFGGGLYYLDCCPFALIKSDEALDITNAYKWFDKGNFFHRFPDPPVGLIKAIESLDMAQGYCENERYKNKK